MTLCEEIEKIGHRREMEDTLSLFSLRDEVLALLQQPAYRKNWLAVRMEEGQKLKTMAQQLIDDRRYILKFKEKEREEYNQRIQELEDITSHARHLRSHSFFSSDSPEGGALMGGIGAVLLSGCMVASHTRNVDELFTGVATLATIGLYATLGANVVNFNYGSQRYQRPKMWKEIQYIDNILQKR